MPKAVDGQVRGLRLRPEQRLREGPQGLCGGGDDRGGGHGASEKDVKLAQKLGQLQPFIAVFPQECMANLRLLGQPNTFLARGTERPPGLQDGAARPREVWRRGVQPVVGGEVCCNKLPEPPQQKEMRQLECSTPRRAKYLIVILSHTHTLCKVHGIWYCTKLSEKSSPRFDSRNSETF